MKTPTKVLNRKSLKIIILSVLVATLATGGIVYAIQQNKDSNPTQQNTDKVNEVNLDSPAQEEIDSGNATKDDTVSPEKTPVNNDAGTPQNSTAMTISSKNQNGDMLQIRVQISTLSNSGLCTLTLSDGNKAITRTAPVQALASVTTCEGFDVDIPSSGLEKGNWSIKLDYSSESLKGTTSDTVTIK